MNLLNAISFTLYFIFQTLYKNLSCALIVNQNLIKIYQFNLSLKIKVTPALILIKKYFVFQIFWACLCRFEFINTLLPVTFSYYNNFLNLYYIINVFIC